MIKRREFLATLALAAVAKAAEIRPAGGEIRGGRINYVATYDADAQDFFTRVEAAGGTISTPTRVAVNAFVVSAKANGYWTKLTRINLFCGDQLAAALVPLKVGGGNATDTNNNFVAGDYSEATGLTGNGTTKYLQTGILASALTTNDTHFATYDRSSTVQTGGHGVEGGGARFLLLPGYTGSIAYSDQYGFTGGRVSSAITTPFGFVVASRTAANSHAIYRNGVSLASNATSEGAPPALEIFIIAANNGAGVPTVISTHPFGGYSFGSGLTGGNVTSYYTDIQAAMTAFGRAVAP